MSSTDEQPLVSVIMPTYNSGGSLRSAVMSVLEQSLARLEIIIVDDASSDDTTSVVEDMMRYDPRIVYLRQSCNSGPSAARNVALAVARGTWIAPVDADDEINRDRLFTLCEAGESLSADLIADGVLFVGARRSGTPPQLSYSQPSKGLSIEALIESDIPLNGLCSLGYLKPLIRRDFLCRFDLKYDEELRFAEDFNLYARALLCGARFFLHPGSHYTYHQTPRSATRSEGVLPGLARYALLGNRKLSGLIDPPDQSSISTLLASHRLRWATILWFNRLRAAVRSGESGEALRLLLNCPGGSPNMAAFARDKVRVNLEHARLELPTPRGRVSIRKNIGYS